VGCRYNPQREGISLGQCEGEVPLVLLSEHGQAQDGVLLVLVVTGEPLHIHLTSQARELVTLVEVSGKFQIGEQFSGYGGAGAGLEDKSRLYQVLW